MPKREEESAVVGVKVSNAAFHLPLNIIRIEPLKLGKGVYTAIILFLPAQSWALTTNNVLASIGNIYII